MTPVSPGTGLGMSFIGTAHAKHSGTLGSILKTTEKRKEKGRGRDGGKQALLKIHSQLHT